LPIFCQICAKTFQNRNFYPCSRTISQGSTATKASSTGAASTCSVSRPSPAFAAWPGPQQPPSSSSMWDPLRSTYFHNPPVCVVRHLKLLHDKKNRIDPICENFFIRHLKMLYDTIFYNICWIV
jgi:hypothetical protein